MEFQMRERERERIFSAGSSTRLSFSFSILEMDLNMGGKQSSHQSYHRNTSHSNRSQSTPGSSRYVSYSGYYDNTDRSSNLQSRYTRIGDDYISLEEVTGALTYAGLESSNLIVGIDFTKSNEWTGARSFNHRNLHHLGGSLNPYEQAISIIGRTLSTFDEDNAIPCYGFGDASTQDQEVFSFYQDERPCHGFEEVLSRYRELVPQLNLAGPTSFAPIIETAIGIVDKSRGQYHVLMIIADGQVTRSVDTSYDQLSPQEKATIDAIVKASDYPLSIVLVGVGDGPWDMIQQFDDNIPSRAFDNFQFVNFTEIMSRNIPAAKKEAEFALASLMEIPSQYQATIHHHLLGCQKGTLARIPLPPPTRNYNSPNPYPTYSQLSGLEEREEIHYSPSCPPMGNYSQNRNCPECLQRKSDLAFGCGHLTCYYCGKDMTFCPVCRNPITTTIKLLE